MTAVLEKMCLDSLEVFSNDEKKVWQKEIFFYIF